MTRTWAKLWGSPLTWSRWSRASWALAQVGRCSRLVKRPRFCLFPCPWVTWPVSCCCGLLAASFPVYHPRTGYSNRSRCSSTSSSVTSPSLQETPPLPPTQTQSPPSETRPPPNKQVRLKFLLQCCEPKPAADLLFLNSQIFQGNRRTFQGQGYHSGSQRYNGGLHGDRNPGRPNHRYRSDGGSAGPTSHNNSRGPPRSSTYNQDRTSHNGLPQRLPRPWQDGPGSGQHVY